MSRKAELAALMKKAVEMRKAKDFKPESKEHVDLTAQIRQLIETIRELETKPPVLIDASSKPLIRQNLSANQVSIDLQEASSILGEVLNGEEITMSALWQVLQLPALAVKAILLMSFESIEALAQAIDDLQENLTKNCQVGPWRKFFQAGSWHRAFGVIVYNDESKKILLRKREVKARSFREGRGGKKILRFKEQEVDVIYPFGKEGQAPFTLKNRQPKRDSQLQAIRDATEVLDQMASGLGLAFITSVPFAFTKDGKPKDWVCTNGYIATRGDTDSIQRRYMEALEASGLSEEAAKVEYGLLEVMEDSEFASASAQNVWQLVQTTCAECKRTGAMSDFQVCPDCNYSRYCSEECRKKGQSKHKIRCKAFKLAAEKFNTQAEPKSETLPLPLPVPLE